ncbi:MAG TPA: TerB N-terminal domain-containing protein [Phycisphaerae bacterium]|nr:TerB N-terminal domain-containing protein [Phycisphaerae bacterium]
MDYAFEIRVGAAHSIRGGSPAELRWLGKGQTLRVHGLEIKDPLTYTGTTGVGFEPADPSQIDPVLAATPATSAIDLPYWPWFAALNSEQRCLYLKWLASDRRSLPPTDGYLFLYYYGLERRVLVDGEDKALVFAEVYRLRKMHAAQSPRRPRNSFQNYSTAFLWYMIAKYSNSVGFEAVSKIVNSTAVWTEDALETALAWFALRAAPLPSWMAYVVAAESGLSQHSVVIKRAETQFNELFTKRFETEFGDRLILKASKRDKSITYRPASAALTPSTVRLPGVLTANAQIRRLSAIWNECVEELRRFSSVVRNAQDQDALTPAAWEALPPDLRKATEHPLAQSMFALVAKQTDESGQVFLKVSDLAALADLGSRQRLTPTQSRSLASMAEYAGFGIEPDARLTGRGYYWEEPLAVFPQAYSGEPDHSRYGAAACMLRLGVEIAEADGKINDGELHRVMEQIEAGFELNDHERRRLEALRSLLLKTGSDVAGLGKRLQKVMGEEARRNVGRLLVAVAGIDGVISKGELTALRRCYRALGLGPDLLEGAIAELAPELSDAPVVVQRGRRRGEGEAIPAPPPKEEGVRLDRNRVMQIMAETREVSILLAEAMRREDDEGEKECDQGGRAAVIAATPQSVSAPVVVVSPAPPNPGAAVPTGDLPARYAAFFEVLRTRPSWNKAEAGKLAREHAHMLAGALEAINDWAFERVGVPIINEDGDSVRIDQSILKEVTVP